MSKSPRIHQEFLAIFYYVNLHTTASEREGLKIPDEEVVCSVVFYIKIFEK
ncbi:MAG: hypothetical protein IPG53_23460 [Ignavibacteriales bacterium]|nr:hypothetical protein [Ignavibacteriales bacterium]